MESRSPLPATTGRSGATPCSRCSVPRDNYFLRAESFFNVVSYMDEVGYVEGYGGSLHTKSHGEAFMVVLLNKLRGNGIYLFDEPEAALSPNR
jgi:predicted ATPase